MIDKYYLICFLPITLTILIVFIPQFLTLAKKNLGFLIIFIVYIIRYTIMPLLLVFSDLTGFTVYSYSNSLNIAISLMIYEMVVCTLILVYFGNKYITIEKEVENNKLELFNPNKFNLIYYIIIFISLCLIILFPNLINNFQFFNISETRLVPVSYFRGLDIRILIIAKLIIFLSVLKFLSFKYQLKENNLYYFIGLIFSFLFISIFQGENRTNIIVDLIVAIVALHYLFPQRAKLTKLAITLFGTVLISTVSFYRLFAPRSWRPEGEEVQFNLEFFINNFQVYVSGPQNIALGIETVKLYKNNIDINTLFNDVFVWTGYIGNALNIDTSNTTSYLFNLYINGTDPAGEVSTTQIVPMIVQGYSYFGFLGAPLFSVILCFIIIFLERVIKKARDIDSIVIYTYILVRCSLFMGLNITIISMFLFDKFMQIYIAYKLNKIIKIKKNK